MKYLTTWLAATLAFMAAHADVTRQQGEATLKTEHYSPAAASYEAPVHDEHLASERLHHLTALHFQYCQAVNHMQALSETWRDGYRRVWDHNEERHSITEFALRVSMRRHELMTVYGLTDQDILAAGFGGGNERLFGEHCWPLYSKPRLSELPELPAWQVSQARSAIERRIEGVKHQIDTLRSLKVHEGESTLALPDEGMDELDLTLLKLHSLRNALHLLAQHNTTVVYIRASLDRLVTVTVYSGDTVDDIKSDVSAATGIRPDQYTLVFDGEQLEDGHPIKEYDLRNDAILHLIKYLPHSRSKTDPIGIDVAAEESNDDPDNRMSLQCFSDFETRRGCFLTIPYLYNDVPLEPWSLLINFTAGPEPGSVLLNGAPLEALHTEYPSNADAEDDRPGKAYLVPADQDIFRLGPDIRSRPEQFESQSITRWSLVAEMDAAPGHSEDEHTYEVEERRYVVRILELDGKAVNLPNIMLGAYAVARETVRLRAVWTYYDVERVVFPQEVWLIN